jgi:protein-S-isoprenylcysteine O-methyltransferase Ste14
MTDNGYGLWFLVVFNSLLFIIFAASFFHPHSKRDWRALGGFSAFVVALFTEMYGYPLTVYLLSGPFAGFVPGVNLSHNSGHLWNDLIGWKGDAHFSPFHLASYAFIGGGFWLIASGWKQLYAAQKAKRLATLGPYELIRHPQYTGFILIMVGFLLQWPTFITLLMFPVLLIVYRRLAIREEREVAAEFAADWAAYAKDRPRFLPHWRQLRRSIASAQARKPQTTKSPLTKPAATRPVLAAKPVATPKRAKGRERIGSGDTRRPNP